MGLASKAALEQIEDTEDPIIAQPRGSINSAVNSADTDSNDSGGNSHHAPTRSSKSDSCLKNNYST